LNTVTYPSLPSSLRFIVRQAEFWGRLRSFGPSRCTTQKWACVGVLRSPYL